MKPRLPRHLLTSIAISIAPVCGTVTAAPVYTNGVWNDRITDSILLDSYETIDISGKTTPLDGAAIYVTEDNVSITGSGSVQFADNTSVWGGAISFDLDPAYPVFDESRTLTFSGNASITFSGNTASGGGGALYSGFNTVFTGNGDIDFTGNTDTLTDGAALVTSLGLSFSGNGNVRFRGNFNREDTCLRGLYSRSGPVTLSATTGKSITFYDSAHISVEGGASGIRLNAQYTNSAGKTLTAAGSIIFTGEHTEEDLTAAFQANGLTAKPTEAQIKASRTSRIINNGNDTTLEAGSLVIKDGAELKIKGVGMSNGNLTVMRSAGTPGGTKVILENGAHLEAYTTFSKGTSLHVKGANKLTGALTLESGAGLSFVLCGDKDTPLLSTNATIIQKGALNITIDPNGEGVGKYALVSTTYFDTAHWTNELVTVTGADFDQLRWSVGEDNMYHLDYADGEILEEDPEPAPPDDPVPSVPGSLTWSNAEGNGIWSETAKNWQDNGSVYVHTDGVAVFFGDAGAGTVILQGRLSPAAVTVDSAADYTFTGDGSMSGGMNLTKQGKGTLTLNGNNSYSGGTTISAGKVIATGADSFGSGGITVRNATLDLGHKAVRNNVSISGTSTITNATAYAGTAILTKGGMLKLSGNLSGTLILGGGSLDLTGVKELSTLRLGNVKTTASLTTIIVNHPESYQPDTAYTLMTVAEDSSINTAALELAGVEGATLEMKGDKLVLSIAGVPVEPPVEPADPEDTPPQNPMDEETEAHLRAGMVYTTLMGAQISGNISAMDTLRGAMGLGRHAQTGEMRYSVLATGAYSNTSGKGDTPGYERSAAGALLVAERAFSTRIAGGLAAGYECAKASADEHGDWTSADTRMTAYALYAGSAWQSSTAIGLGLHRYEVDRNADGRSAQASPDGLSLNFMQEISYVIPWRGDKRLEPFLRVDSSFNKIGAFAETGDIGPGALYVDGQDAWATHVTLGMRYSGALNLGGALKPACFTLEAGLTKDIGDESDMLTVRMDSDRTHGLELAPASRGRWGAGISGGVTIPLKEHHTISIGAGAKARLQGSDTDFNANVGYSYTF